MRKIILKLAFVGLLAPTISYAQNTKISTSEEKQKFSKPYNENEDGYAEISKLILKAQKERKNIMIQAGGNWCIWCLRFDNFVNNTPELKQLVEENFIYYHLNFSPKNKNERAFAKYGTDQKIGYPYFIILNKDGKKLHIQESGILEEGEGYSVKKVKAFFEKWTPNKEHSFH